MAVGMKKFGESVIDYYLSTENKLIEGVLEWHFLGGGHFARAVKNEKFPGIVVRVSTYESSSGRGKDGWLAYIKWAMKQHSRHAPKVYAMRELEDRIITVMEELFHIHWFNDAEEMKMAQKMCQGLSFDFQQYGKGSVRTFVRKIDKAPELANYQRDLHGNNVMIRKDGTPVITDPLCWPS